MSRTEIAPAEWRDVGDPRPPLRLLYIAGVGHSGSTLVGRLLGELPGAMHLGDLALLFRAYLRGRDCHCGAPLAECPFWAPVLERSLGAMDRQRASSIYDVQTSVIRTRRLFELRRPGWPLEPEDPNGQLLLSIWDEVLRAAREQSGADWLIDNSKSEVRALALSHMWRIELAVLHLVRDPRGVAYSYLKADSEMPTWGATTTAGKWITSDALQRLLARRADRYIRLRYEDFSKDPAGKIEEVRSALGLPEAKIFGDDGRTVTFHSPEHYVALNSRHRERADIRVRLDDQWFERLAARDRRLVEAFCAPMMRRYGYQLRPTPGASPAHSSVATASSSADRER